MPDHTDTASLRAERLRGSLPKEEPGSRGIESVARNRPCLRLTALTIAGITPASALERVYGMPAPDGPSPFAVARGNRFEHGLIAKDGENPEVAHGLLDLYRKAGLLGTEATALDMSVAYPMDHTRPAETLGAREQASTELVVRALSGDTTVPALLVKPRLRITLAGVTHPTEPDALVIVDGCTRGYRPVEIKSYQDLGPLTSQSKTGSACRQAAVAVVTLRQIASARGLPLAPAEGDLVFARAVSASLTPMALDGEVDSIVECLADCDANLTRIEEIVCGGSLDNPDTLDLVPAEPAGSCADHCALWERCRMQVAADGDPLALGDDARELLAQAGTLPRAVALRDGAPPRNDGEALLGTLLAEATVAHRKALHG